MIKQMKKISQKALASLLCVIMLLSFVPTQVFAAFAEAEAAKGEAVQFSVSDYVTIDNGYITCYVDKDTGGFAILPSTVDLDVDRQASHATFLIDGNSYVFGQYYEGMDTSLSAPTVKNDGELIETSWTILGYEIIQYQAIAQEFSYDGSYAVYLHYNVCYLGEGESQLGARILIDTMFGEDDMLPVTVSNNPSYISTEMEITDIPEDFRVSPELGSTVQAFGTLLDENVTKPSSLVFARMDNIKNAAYGYAPSEDEAFLGDSAVALYYAPAVMGESEEDRYVSISAMYGFYGIEKYEPIKPVAMVSLFSALGDFEHSVKFVDKNGIERPEYADYFNCEWAFEEEDDPGSYMANAKLNIFYTEKNFDFKNRPIYEIVKVEDPQMGPGNPDREFSEILVVHPLALDEPTGSSRRKVYGAFTDDEAPATPLTFDYVVTVAPARKVEFELAVGYTGEMETFLFWNVESSATGGMLDTKDRGSGFYTAEGNVIQLKYVDDGGSLGAVPPSSAYVELIAGGVGVEVPYTPPNYDTFSGNWYEFTVPASDVRLSGTTNTNNEYSLWSKSPTGVTVTYSSGGGGAVTKAKAGETITATVTGSPGVYPGSATASGKNNLVIDMVNNTSNRNTHVYEFTMPNSYVTLDVIPAELDDLKISVDFEIVNQTAIPVFAPGVYCEKDGSFVWDAVFYGGDATVYADPGAIEDFPVDVLPSIEVYEVSARGVRTLNSSINPTMKTAATIGFTCPSLASLGADTVSLLVRVTYSYMQQHTITLTDKNGNIDWLWGQKMYGPSFSRNANGTSYTAVFFGTDDELGFSMQLDKMICAIDTVTGVSPNTVSLDRDSDIWWTVSGIKPSGNVNIVFDITPDYSKYTPEISAISPNFTLYEKFTTVNVRGNYLSTPYPGYTGKVIIENDKGDKGQMTFGGALPAGVKRTDAALYKVYSEDGNVSFYTEFEIFQTADVSIGFSYHAIVSDANNNHSVVKAATLAELNAGIAGKTELFRILGDSTESGNTYTFRFDRNKSVLIGPGLSATMKPFGEIRLIASGGTVRIESEGVTLSVPNLKFYESEGGDAVDLGGGVISYDPPTPNNGFSMTLSSGTDYKNGADRPRITWGSLGNILGKLLAVTSQLGVTEYNGVTLDGNDLIFNGKLKVWFPVIDLELAGLDINRLVFTHGEGGMKFKGVDASGEIRVNEFLGVIPESYITGTVNTLDGYYAFDVLVDVKVLKIGGKLTLVQLWNGVLFPDEIELFFGGDLFKFIPGFEVVTIDKVGGGVYGLASLYGNGNPRGYMAPVVTAKLFGDLSIFELIKANDISVSANKNGFSLRGPSLSLALRSGDTDFAEIKMLDGIGADVYYSSQSIGVHIRGSFNLSMLPGFIVGSASLWADYDMTRNSFSFAGEVSATVQIPQFKIACLSFGPYELFKMTAYVSNVEAYVSFRVIGKWNVRAGYVYGKQFYIDAFSAASLSLGGGGIDSYERAYDENGNQVGTYKITHNLRLISSSDNPGGGFSGIMPLSLSPLAIGASPTLTPIDDYTYEVDMPLQDDYSDYMIFVNTEKDGLEVKRPGGGDYALKFAPNDGVSQDDPDASSYNAFEADGGIVLILDGHGVWTITNTKNTISIYLYEIIALPEIEITSVSGSTVNYSTSNLGTFVDEYELVFIASKADGGGQQADAIIGSETLSGSGANGAHAFAISADGFPDYLEAGDYVIKAYLYHIDRAPGTLGADDLGEKTMLHAATSTTAYTYSNPNAPAADSTFALSYGGNGEIRAMWGLDSSIVNGGYLIKAYDAQGEPVLVKATLDDGTAYHQHIVYDIPVGKAEGGVFDVRLTGLEPGSTYILELVPYNTEEVVDTIGGEESYSYRYHYGTGNKESISLPLPVYPNLSYTLDGAMEGNEDGIQAIYARRDFTVNIETDVIADITVTKNDGDDTIETFLNTQSASYDFETGDSGSYVLTIKAETTAGDYVEKTFLVIINDTPPSLFVDSVDGVVSASRSGSYTIQGYAPAGMMVYCSNGETETSATAGADGRFSMTGSLGSGVDESVLSLSVSDMAGNTSSLLVTVQVGAAGGSGYDGSTATATPPTTPSDDSKTTDLPSGFTLDTPDGQDPVDNGDGSTTLPGGGTITIGGPAGQTDGQRPPLQQGSGTTITVPPGTVIDGDGRISFPPGSGGGTITDRYGNTFSIPEDAVILLDMDTPLGYFISIDNPFSDVRQSDWFYDAVMFSYSHGLMNGVAPDKFSPNTPITRAMIVTVLYRMSSGANSQFTIHNSQFEDVDDGFWYSDAVAWAASNGIVNGYGDGRYGPNDNITRQDLAVILARYADFKGINLANSQSTLHTPHFTDDADISGYAKSSVETLYAAGIVNGYPDGSFKPRETATRAEVAVMLQRFMEAME